MNNIIKIYLFLILLNNYLTITDNTNIKEYCLTKKKNVYCSTYLQSNNKNCRHNNYINYYFCINKKSNRRYIKTTSSDNITKSLSDCYIYILFCCSILLAIIFNKII